MSSLCVSENPKPSHLRRLRRREKSRDAARCRRHKESDTFEEICNTIPLPQDAINHLDKSAVMRLLISYIKLRETINKEAESVEFPGIKQEFVDDVARLTDDDYVSALNAFVLILSSELDVLYVSDNVKQFLGLPKFDLIGQSILTYAHEGDHDDIRDCFSGGGGTDSHHTFFLRLKSTLTSNGKSINLKSASHKVLRCSGVVKPATDDSSYMIAHAEPIPHPSNIQHFLDSKTFVTQHSPDMKFTYCDDRFAALMGYSDSDMVDQSFFDFCHAADLKSVGGFFQKLFKLSQVETDRYRIMAKTGGYHWLVTQATVIANQKNHKAQCVVCVHYVISGLVEGDTQLSIEQLKRAKELPPTDHVTRFEQVSLHPLEAVETAEEIAVAEDSLAQTPETGDDLEVDDCSVVPLTFTELDENDAFFGDDIYFNAPSIGDPWAYSANQEMGNDKIEDLFGDVVLNGGGQQLPQTLAPSFNQNLPTFLLNKPMTKVAQFETGQCNDVGMTSPGHPPDYGGPFTPPTQGGSLSPCDSAYCGSPARDQEHTHPYTPIELMSNLQRIELPPNVAKHPQPAYQPVTIPRDKYDHHVKNLKRGFVECAGGDAVYQWPRKPLPYKKLIDPDPPKRRRFEPFTAPSPPSTCPEPASSFSYSDLIKSPTILMQPGDGFGCHGPDQEPSLSNVASFLLQPEMNFNGKQGRRIARNISSGRLPELSLRDCEVNAPLQPDNDRLPWARDCVDALDSDF